MFDFNEELKYYQKCLEAEEISEGMSGDEMKDILDILRAMQSKPARAEAPQTASREEGEPKES